MGFLTSQLEVMLLLLLTLLLSPHGRAQQTYFPSAVPLAVRSPYFTCWDYFKSGSTFGNIWPTTYNSDQILGWSVLVRVDGLTYSFLGDAPSTNGTVTLTNTVVTPTQTVFTAEAGRMQFNLTFLNPIEPGDWVKQSIPFSYMSLTAKSLDGAAHTVQVYSDVSGEWNSGNRDQVIRWTATSTADVIFHTVTLQTPSVFNETSGQANWGTLYYAMKAGDKITYKIARDILSRGSFVLNGVLDNQVETNFRAISFQFAVFAISRDLGTIQATQAPVVWTVGYTTDPAINYADLSGAPPTQRSLYYKSQYSDDQSLIVDFLNDFSNASSRAQQLDQKILQDAASISDLLGDLISLGIAQTYGSTQLTIGMDANGNFNQSDAMMFMKNIGGVTTNRVNAVETLYAAFPAFMYLDPTLGAPLLEPLFRFQASPNYSIPFAAADLGSSYPSVAGNNSNHGQGVEQSGNMLIMTYAHARASGSARLISRYYPVLTSWANYLLKSTLFIHNQSSADNLSVNNQTNLAIKGIIAIEAMSKMSAIVKQAADAEKYSNAASHLYSQWKGLAFSSNQHVFAVYGQNNSWTLGYNLFADTWLGTNLVESSVYETQSSFLDAFAVDPTNNFGLPVDSIGLDMNVAVSSWNLLAAAMTSNSDLRANLISRVHSRAFFNVSAGVFPVIYDSTRGSTILGVASPAQGAMFAPLALKAVRTIEANATTAFTPPKTASHTGAVAGAVVGTLGALLVVIGVAAFMRRRRRLDKRKSIGSSFSSAFMEAGAQVTVTPYHLAPLEVTQRDPGPWMTGPQPQSGPLEATTAPDTHSSSSHSLPLPPPVVPAPVGLSSKELAQLRTDAVLRSQNNHARSGSSSSQPDPSPPVTTIQRAATTTNTRRLQSEVEDLRREMQLLRAERFEAPPSYAEEVA